METQQDVEDSSQAEMNLIETRIDLRAMPPTRMWQQFRQSGPDLAHLRAQVEQMLGRLAIEVALEEYSWSVGFLWDLGGVADALNSLLHSSRVEDPSLVRGSFLLDKQLLEHRKLRAARKRLQREAFNARRAGGALKS